MAQRTTPNREPARKQALELVKNCYRLLVDQKGHAFIQVNPNQSRAVQIKSEECSAWVFKSVYEKLGIPLSAQDLKDVTDNLASLAKYNGDKTHTAWRIFKGDNSTYVDLGDGKIACITDQGCTITTIAEGIHFIESAQKLPLPSPVMYEELNLLRSYFNLANDNQWYLLLSSIIGLFMGLPSRPIITFTGSEGCAKSTQSSLIQKIVDPNPVIRQLPPEKVEDLIISSLNSTVFVIDNVGQLNKRVMNALCALSTGLEYKKRQFYTEFGTVSQIIDSTLIINGINPEFIKQSDLASRVVWFPLPTISPESRVVESDYWTKFEADKPKILGSLYNILSKVLKVYDEVEFTPVSRLSDFCQVGNALESILEWPQGAFDTAMLTMQSDLKLISLDSDALGRALLALMKKQECWEGSSSALLDKLCAHSSPKQHNSDSWPSSAMSLGRKLRALEPALNSQGISINFRKSNDRLITLSKVNHSQK
ncbi:TPA: hypothetical protein ACGVAS_003128 [Vibrio vulnificus]|nr:hypothetical protein [Vibrio vulnificus]